MMPSTIARTPQNAIIIGNGVIGLASAIALQRRGIVTTIVAPDQPWRGASWGNAGHIAVEQGEPIASLATLRSLPRMLFWNGGPVSLPPRAIATWLPFALRLMRASTPSRFAHGTAALQSLLAGALPAWRQLLSAADATPLLRDKGHVLAWESATSAARGLKNWHAAQIGTAGFDEMSPGELQKLRDLVPAPIAGAIRFHGTGKITDPSALGEALHSHFRALGGQQHYGRAIALDGKDSALVTLEDGRTLAADLALVAAGVASAPLLKPLGFKVPLIAERGYHIESAHSSWPFDTPAIVFEDRSIVVNRFVHGLRATSFVEFTRADSPPDHRKWDRLRAHVGDLGLGFDEHPSEWIGCRPTLPDYLPAIGRIADRPAIAYAFGHNHLGLTLSAVTGELVGALAQGEVCSVDMTPFRLDRFS